MMFRESLREIRTVRAALNDVIDAMELVNRNAVEDGYPNADDILDDLRRAEDDLRNAINLALGEVTNIKSAVLHTRRV